MSIFEECPVLENDVLQIRLVEEKDVNDLFLVYNDQRAVPYFNSDYSHGETLYFQTKERMENAIIKWIRNYKRNKLSVRMTIFDKLKKKAIGTIEAFRRTANDFFNDVCLMNIDLGSEFEQHYYFKSILELVSKPFYNLFECDKIVTKYFVKDTIRYASLLDFGFEDTQEKMIGFDGKIFGNYCILKNNG